MSDQEKQVEVLRREFWRLEIVAGASSASHVAKANAERRREIEADLQALGSSIGYGDSYTPPAFVGAIQRRI